MEIKENPGCQESREHLVHQVSQVYQVHPVSRENQENLERKECRVLQECTVNQDLRVRREEQARRETKATVVTEAPQVQQEILVPQADLASTDKRVTEVKEGATAEVDRSVLLVQPVISDLLDHQDPWDHKVSEEAQDLQDHPDHLDHLELAQGMMFLLDLLIQEITARPDHRVQQELLDHQARRGHVDLVARVDPPGSQGTLEFPECPDLPVLQVNEDSEDSLECQECPGYQVNTRGEVFQHLK